MRACLRRRATRGQSTVEYLLLISVLVLALWAVSQALADGMEEGLQLMSRDVEDMAQEGYVGGGS